MKTYLTNIFAITTTSFSLPANLIKWIEGISLFGPVFTLIISILSIISIILVIRNNVQKRRLNKLDIALKEAQYQEYLQNHKQSQ